MSRIYAAILGPLAFTVVLVRGLRHGGEAESVLLTASICLFAFASLGYLAGALATWIIEDSVRSKVAAEVAAQQAQAGRANQASAI